MEVPEVRPTPSQVKRDPGMVMKLRKLQQAGLINMAWER